MLKSSRILAAAGAVAGLGLAVAPLNVFATDHLYPNTHQDKLSVTIETLCSFGYDASLNDNDVNAGNHVNGTPIPPKTATSTDTVGEKTAGQSYGVWDSSTLTDKLTLADGSDGDIHGISTYDVQTEGVPSTTPTDTTAVADTVYGIMENATVNNDFARTTMAIVCNNASGYTVKAVTTDLTKGDGTDAKDKIPFAATNGMTAVDNSAWNFKVANTTTEAMTAASSGTNASTIPTTAAASVAGLGTLTSAKADYTTSFTSGDSIATSTGTTSKSGDRITVTYGVAVNAAQEAGTYEGTITYTLVKADEA